MMLIVLIPLISTCYIPNKPYLHMPHTHIMLIVLIPLIPSCYIPNKPYLHMPHTHTHTLFVDSYRREIRYLWTAYDFDTTVVYIYSGNDGLYPDNLNYFLRHGVKQG